MLAKRRSEQLFMVPWRARGTVAFEADLNVGTLVCPASPRPTVRCALRRPDPPVCVRVLDSTGLHRQKGDGTLVSSKERIVAVFPQVNRGSTARCAPVGLSRIFFVRASEGAFRTTVFDALRGKRGGCVLGGPTRRRPLLPGPAPPRRPALGRSDSLRPWHVRVYDSTSVSTGICRVQNPDIPRAGVGAHGGAAGRGRAGLDANRNVRPGNNGDSRTLQGIEKNCLNVRTSPQKHEQAKSYLNRMWEQNFRLTRGLSAVYHRDEKRSLFLAADQWTVAFLSL